MGCEYIAGRSMPAKRSTAYISHRSYRAGLFLLATPRLRTFLATIIALHTLTLAAGNYKSPLRTKEAHKHLSEKVTNLVRP